MSIELLDEHEQGERVRAWLRDNGASLITGVVLGLSAILGWQWWGGARLGHRYEAAAQFQALQEAVKAGDRDAVRAISVALRKDYSETAYAILGAMSWAERQLDGGEFAGAVTTLEDASRLAGEPALKALVNTRLARAQIAFANPDAALRTLELVPKDRFEAVVEELRGDALAAKGKLADAQASWKRALDKLESGSQARQALELKLSDHGSDGA